MEGGRSCEPVELIRPASRDRSVFSWQRRDEKGVQVKPGGGGFAFIMTGTSTLVVSCSLVCMYMDVFRFKACGQDCKTESDWKPL